LANSVGRVLVVDDSAFMRTRVADILRRGGFEVAGTARDGMDALDQVDRLKPDVITLDIEMPKMNGVQFLTELMKRRPTPVVMLSSLTASGADISMQCLALGAFECLQKPSGSISLDIEKIETSICETVRAALTANVRTLRPSGSQPAAVERAAAPTPPPAGSHKVIGTSRSSAQVQRVIAIASSTGGPAALSVVIPSLGPCSDAAVLVVQHLPVGFTESLARRLDAMSPTTVREAVEGDRPSAGTVLIAPGGRHMLVDSKGRIAFSDDPPIWGVRPAADVMMTSVAKYYGNRSIGVVLTGMGRDGSMGVRAIHRAGGWCCAQDQETSVVYGMPRAAAETGEVDRIAPLTDIGNQVRRAQTLMAA
jgi:two-component system chemotaxis response regulator CheB